MITSIENREKLRGTARVRAQQTETRTVGCANMDQYLTTGWRIEKKNRKSVRLSRVKDPDILLVERVWSLFYRMAFEQLTDSIPSAISGKTPASERIELPIVAIGDEIAVAVRCYRRAALGRPNKFREWLQAFAAVRERFAHEVNVVLGRTVKRTVVLVAFVENVVLAEEDEEFARDLRVALFAPKDLEYYETLVAQVGPAAKYQLLADVLPGRSIAGLEIRVPAVKLKIGGYICYTFSITPDYLLKIAYVSHRSKGKASDVETYQRMLTKGRLRRIREYIDDNGIFPTNIVVNLESKRLQFQRARQEGDDEGGVLGWLDIKPTYKAAWIIDGQHRLFAYSGHPKAATDRLAVLAFDGLPPSKQAALFIDINAKQKSVKQSLLQELYAELHWDADDPHLRVRAIISKAIQSLDADLESAVFERIQTSDVARDEKRCITVPALFGALERGEFFITKERRGDVVEFGPLWAGGNTASLRRTIIVVKAWLNGIRDRTAEWWDKGAGIGGGLAMNDGVVACIGILKSIMLHAESRSNTRLLNLKDAQLVEVIAPYAAALGDYFARLGEHERKAFRDLRGNQGITTRLRHAQLALREVFPEFEPPGLDEFVRLEKEQTNIRAKAIVDSIETTLHDVILEELKREMGEKEWWTRGVPQKVRLKAGNLFEQDDGRRGGRDRYFDLIDYRDIADTNWQLFEPLLAMGSGSKDKRTAWLVFVNDQRRIVSHASAGTNVTLEDLSELERYQQWLLKKLSADEHVDDASAERI